MHPCLHTSVCVFLLTVYMCKCISFSVYKCVSLYVLTVYASMSAYMLVCVFVLTVYTSMSAYKLVCVFVLSVYTCLCVHVCIHVCIFVLTVYVYDIVSMSADKCIYTHMCNVSSLLCLGLRMRRAAADSSVFVCVSVRPSVCPSVRVITV